MSTNERNQDNQVLWYFGTLARTRAQICALVLLVFSKTFWYFGILTYSLRIYGKLFTYGVCNGLKSQLVDYKD